MLGTTLRALAPEEEGRRSERFWRVADVLIRIGMHRLVFEQGGIHAELIAEAFPRCFSMFVDSLSDRPTDRQLLRDALAAIEPARLEAGARELAREGAFAERTRVTRILATAHRAALPIAQAIAESDVGWSRALVAAFLAPLDLPRPEAAALRCVVPAGELPSSYLSGLCAVARSGEGDPGVRRRSALLLLQFLESSVDRSELTENRVRAVAALADLPGPETVAALRALRGGLLSWRGGKAGRRVREAARKALAALEASGRPS